MKVLLKKFWYLFALLIIIDTFFIITCTIPANKELTMPGGLTEVESFITVSNGTKIRGSFNTIYVTSFDKATILQSWIASQDIVNSVTETDTRFDYSLIESQKSGQIQKNQSIEGSLICAYNSASKTSDSVKLNYKFEGYIVYYYEKNNTIFEMGDIITGVSHLRSDGSYEEITIDTILSKAELRAAIVNVLNNKAIGDTIYYTRNNQELSVTITEDNYIDYDNKCNYFWYYEKYSILQTLASPAYSISSTKTSGPSGGLLQTLSIYCQIRGVDLTKGKKIAGTGTIGVDGSVGAIGGIEQKIVTAIREGVDVFLCPKANYEDALARYNSTLGHESMKLICVATFDEAVSSLEAL